MCQAQVLIFTSCSASVMIQRRRRQRARLALMTLQSILTMCVSSILCPLLLLLLCSCYAPATPLLRPCYAMYLLCAARSAQLTSVRVASPSVSVCLHAPTAGGLHLISTRTVPPGSLDEAGPCHFAQWGRGRLGRHGHKPGATVAAQWHYATVLSGHALAERRP